ncbi:hypothetical protein [Lonepinella sp. BR2474]|uniref:hypothetical protein n=1 Tax=unclassified Lonepinella TaxID=2642006 RepID=UPI003F6DAD7F
MIELLNLFKLPIEKETLESWIKIIEDIAKVAILALPVVIFGQGDSIFKVSSSIGLVVIIYFLLLAGRYIRQYKFRLQGE